MVPEIQSFTITVFCSKINLEYFKNKSFLGDLKTIIDTFKIIKL